MPQAIIDPNELRRFAHVLKKFHAELRDGLGSVQSQLTGLGDTWRDQEHDKFVLEFEQTVLVVEKFLAACEEHIPFLLRKAERAEDYLQQR